MNSVAFFYYFLFELQCSLHIFLKYSSQNNINEKRPTRENEHVERNDKRRILFVGYPNDENL